jgi:putative oxidoreductase
MTPIRTVARALLAAVFVRGGLSAYNNPDALVEGAKPVTDRLAPALDAVGLPTDTRTLVRLNGAVQMAGGVLLATNTLTRPAALALAGSLVPTTLAGHDFWSREQPTERVGHQIHFLKNLGLLGGLLLAAVDTEGRPSLAWRTGHLAGHASDSVRRAARTTTKETRRAAHTTARETRRAARLTAKEAQRTVGSTARETRRAAHLAAKEARRAALDARRTAKTAARETKLAVKSAKASATLR